MMRTFWRYPEISILNPQTEYFHQNVKWIIFENGHFWGCDVKNWLFEKLVLWIWSICWISPKIVYTQLFLTSDHQNRPYRPIYLKVKKSYFEKKKIFLSKIGSRDVKTEENLSSPKSAWTFPTNPQISFLDTGI